MEENEKVDLSCCPVCGATSGIEPWNSGIVWCRQCNSRIANKWWNVLYAKMCVKMPTDGDCGCRQCNPGAWWMVVCDTCGNKRCPHATDHENACTHSNAPGQAGSIYA